MENQLQNYSNTLMAELGAWNRQELVFREVFGPDSVQDREFLKMKLDKYERLSQRFGLRAITTDERSLMDMLKYQRQKIARAVYPGLIRRVLHKAAVFLRPALDNKRELEMARQAGLRSYGNIQLPVKDHNTIEAQHKENPVPGQSQRYFQQQRPSQRPKQQHKKGRSI